MIAYEYFMAPCADPYDHDYTHIHGIMCTSCHTLAFGMGSREWVSDGLCLGTGLEPQ